MITQQKKITEPLPDFRRLFEAAPGMYLVLSPDLTIRAASDSYLAATLTVREDILGRYLFDVFPDNPNDPQASGVKNLSASLQRVLVNKTADVMPVQKYDIRRPASQGGGFAVRYWSPQNFPVIGSDGNVEYIIHSITDVTDSVTLRNNQQEKIDTIAEERDSSNRELAKSRLFLQNIINTVVDPIFVKDRKHRWILGNDALWALFGKPGHELLGKSDYDFFPKEEADVFWEKDEIVFTTGQANINEERFTDATGKTHVISTKKSRFIAPNGEPILVGVIRDMTDLREIEEKLKASDEARLKAIMDHSGRVVYVKDIQGKYLRANQSLCDMVGLQEKDIIGKTDYELFSKEHADAFRKNDLTVIEKGDAIEVEEIAPLHNERRIYTSAKFPLYDANGKLYAICGMSADITDRKKVEEQLMQYMRELERSNQELDDFAYIASHDLKEPLRGLYNHSTFLLEDYKDKLDGEGVRRLNRLSDLTQRMEQLINDLLYFSRLGRTQLAIRETDLNKIIHEIKQMMETTLQENNARIEIPKSLPVIVCDKPRITEVFRNLITNAVLHNDKPERLIEIGHHETLDSPKGLQHGVFYVKDNGVGIAPEFHEDVFRIFKTLSKKGKDKKSGSGVGLTYVKKIIERHNGQIWLDSELGKGTVFYFTIGRKAI